MPHADIAAQVRAAATQRILFLPHAVDRMNAPERMISPAEVRSTVTNGNVIEDYPLDVRGHSCLMLGHGDDGRPIHVVCSPKDGYLAIISAYVPNPDRWLTDWRTRRKESS